MDHEPAPDAKPNTLRSNETILKTTAEACEIAIYQSRGAALVNMAASGVDQQQVIARLPSNYHHVTVEQIIERKAEVPSGKTGLVVTGYSRDLIQDREHERDVQGFVRSYAQMNGLNSGECKVLILSDSLPDEEYQDPSLPWYNGPFQGYDSVWSIKSDETSLSLIRHDRKSESVRDPTLRKVVTWVEKETIPFQFSKRKPS